MTTPAASYARISKTDKNIPKVEVQHARNRELAQAEGYGPVTEYTDDGISATNGDDRPDFFRLMEDAAAGKFAVIVATNTDRLSRSPVDTQLLTTACEPHGVTWHTKAQGEIDPGQPDGEFMAALQAMLGRREIRVKNKRHRESNAARREQGVMFRSGPRPFGYDRDRETKAVTINAPEADLIRQGVAMINAGRSLVAVTEMFRESGIAPAKSKVWAQIGVRDQITNWRAAAVVEHQGEPVRDGVWEAIVTREDLEACRAKLLGKRRGQKRLPTRLLSGVALCHCGEYMGGSNRNGKPHYSCTAIQRGLHTDQRHVSITVDMLDQFAIDKLVERYQFGVGDDAPPEAVDGTMGAQIAAARAGLADVEDRRAKLVDLADVLTTDEIRTKLAPLNAQRDQLQQQLDECVAADAAATMRAVAVGELYTDAGGRQRASLGLPTAEDIRARFLSLPTDKQRHLIKMLLAIKVSPGIGTDRVDIKRK